MLTTCFVLLATFQLRLYAYARMSDESHLAPPRWEITFKPPQWLPFMSLTKTTMLATYLWTCAKLALVTQPPEEGRPTDDGETIKIGCVITLS